MITPPPAPSSFTTVPVPVSLLAADGVPPAQGDEVSFSVSGRVASVEGDVARIEPLTINDQPLPKPAPEPDGDEAIRRMAEEDDRAAMRY